MPAIDLHVHTRFFHGHRELGDAFDPIGLRLLAWLARARGLDGVATTNHNYYTRFSGQGLPRSFAVIPGIEISTTQGHVLVIGPDPPAETSQGEFTPAEILDLAHDQGCAAILAHPYRNSTIRRLDLPWDAIEFNGKHPQTHAWARRLAEERGLPVVGGSDAHYPLEVGRAHTVVDVDRPTPAAVAEAIRAGRVEPAVDNRLTHRLMRRFYAYIHEHKGDVEQPEWATPGVGTPPE